MDRTSAIPGQAAPIVQYLFNNSTNGNIEEDAIDKRRTPVNPTEGKQGKGKTIKRVLEEKILRIGAWFGEV